MDRETIKLKKQAIIDRFGEWTNHNICLGDDLYTIGDRTVGSEVKLQRFLQIIADITQRPFADLRVLDLACLEGLYGLELALQGATVVGIEGRETNLAKARFTQEVLGLGNIEFVREDVRDLSREKYGEFDVVLCLGIFYHLDVPDVFEFAENIHGVCRNLAIIDTHVSRSSENEYSYKGQAYRGSSYREDETAWASIGNPESVWLTRPSLYNLLVDVGFSSVYECHQPIVPKFERMRNRQEADRATFVAINNSSVRLKSTPLLDNYRVERFPEQ
ncbi:MAG: class I SAM-dependent methyltransferase [Cyanobacteriota bacterium]|nr:class I SAM-dependent methyltransferase [Cyanobacteriota bacterium]